MILDLWINRYQSKKPTPSKSVFSTARFQSEKKLPKIWEDFFDPIYCLGSIFVIKRSTRPPYTAIWRHVTIDLCIAINYYMKKLNRWLWGELILQRNKVVNWVKHFFPFSVIFLPVLPTMEYECPFCNKIFKNMKFMRQHLTTSHPDNESELECQGCGNKFLSTTRKANHQQKM